MKTFAALIILAILAISCATAPADYSHTSTPELQLEHSQLLEDLDRARLQYGASNSDAQLGISLRQRRITAKKNAVERELLRRYQAGDDAACLPAFPTPPR